MPKLSPLEAVKFYRVSRAKLTKALRDGTLSAEKTDAGHWQIDSAELARIYHSRTPRKGASRPQPENVRSDEPKHNTALDQEVPARLAKIEAELAIERDRLQMLKRDLDELKRMLPAQDNGSGRR